MDAHQIALIMLGRVDQDLTDVATPSVDEVANEIIAISDETRNIRVRTGLKYDFSYAVAVAIRAAGHKIKIDPLVRSRKIQERECRLAVLETATDHVLAKYTIWDEIPVLDRSLYLASNIKHLELAFDISRVRILDWYIRYLMRADCIRGFEYSRDYRHGTPKYKGWGLTPEEELYCATAYQEADYARIYSRKCMHEYLKSSIPYCEPYVFDWWGRLQRKHACDGNSQSYFEMLERLQDGDVAREAERRECMRSLDHEGMIPDLARIAATFC